MSEQANGFDLDLDLDALFEQRPSRVSKEPEVRQVDVVVDRKDPSKGFISLRVQGLSSEDRQSLGRTFERACAVYGQVTQAKEKKAADLNPDDDEIGRSFAEATAKGEAEQWIAKAAELVRSAARDIVAVGVVGWDEGQLRYRGQPVQFAQEKLLIGKRQRLALATMPLRWLHAGNFLIPLASQILKVSDAEETPTKEDQWGLTRKEVAAEPAPLDEAPSETPAS